MFKTILEPALIYEDEELMIFEKPSGMHCASIKEIDSSPTLCEWVFKKYPFLSECEGWKAGEGGLLHRLDFATSGLTAFAKNTNSFNYYISNPDACFTKKYRLYCDMLALGLEGSFPLCYCPSGLSSDDWKSLLRRRRANDIASSLERMNIESYFRPYGEGSKRVACLASDQVKNKKKWTKNVYVTKIENIRSYEDGIYAEVSLEKGFRHQIRAHFAWCGLPIVGDPLYGDSESKINLNSFLGSMCFQAYGLSFIGMNGQKNDVTL